MAKYCLLVVILFFTFQTQAQQLSVIDAPKDFYSLQDRQVWALEDAEHRIGFEQIRQIPDSLFYVPNKYYTNFGISNSAYWVRFRILNKTSERLFFRIINPSLDTAELYVLAKDKLLMRKEVLARKPQMKVPNSPFLLPLSADTLTCYLRVAARVPVYVAMQVIPEASLGTTILWQSAWDILFFGAVLMMVLYNSFLGISTRNISYFYYVVYSFFLTITIFFLKGYAVPLMGNYAFIVDDYFAVYVSVTSIFLYLFAQHFLQLHSYYPLGKRLLDIAGIAQAIVIIIFLLGFVNLNVLLYQIANVFGNVCVGWSAFYLYKKKNYKPALLFLIAFLVFLTLVSAVNLTFANLVPATFMTLYFFHIGSVTELAIFSFALGDKINLYRKEKAQAQAENLKLIQEQNTMLEQKVAERTEELQQTNEELSLTLDTVAKQRDDIISSINYALRIQNATIPTEAELQKYLDCFVFFRPRDIVSGDFYWFAEKEIRDGAAIRKKYVLAVADCTGHGVSGAFMTMIGNNILNQIVNENDITEPDQILNQMPPLLEKTLSHAGGKVKDGMDMAIVTLEKSTNLSAPENVSGFVNLAYAGAMNPLYYVQNGEFREIKADKRPIDGRTADGFAYQKHTLNLTGLTLYLCSDGFQDQFGGSENKKFMTRKLKNLLLEISHKPLAEQQQLLASTFDEWKGNRKQTDDVCLIGIRLG